MQKKFHVYAIGNGIVDLQIKVGNDALARFGLTKGEMRLVDLAAQEELLKQARDHAPHQASGGSAANTIIAIQQLGGRTAFSCLLGDDEFGRFYQGEMQSLGVHTDMQFSAAGPTGTCAVLITPDAERTMNTHLGATAGFGPEHVSAELIREAEWLYIEGYLFSAEAGQRAVIRALELAKQHGTKVALTFSDGFIIDVFGEPLRAAVAQADLIFANGNEARKFTARGDNESAFEALKKAAPNVVMTLSADGAWLNFGGHEKRVAAFPVTALDDTGAGDMFAGGFLYGITHGKSPELSARVACFLAGKVVSQLGPRLQGDVRALLKGVGLE